MIIGVMGLGFVGLTTGVGLALKGHTVLGYDIDHQKLLKISKGDVPFYEEGLQNALQTVLKQRFHIMDRSNNLVEESDVIFLCVGTPSTNAGADLSSVYEAILKIGELSEKPIILIIKSTVPPGTSRTISKMLAQHDLLAKKEIKLINNPEFLREGTALKDFLEPDRIVIGSDDLKSGDRVQELYRPFDAPVWRVSPTTAEFIKYLSNTLLSTLISFSNEMASLGEAMGDVDLKTAFKVLHQDRRWYGNPAAMTSYVWPGCGFGGHCLPKDTYAIIKKAEEFGVEMNVLKSVLKINAERKTYLVDFLLKKMGSLKGKTIAVLGLAFKPNTDDIRDTPAEGIIKILLEKGARVIAYDPLAIKNFSQLDCYKIEYAKSLADAIRPADAVFVVTGWQEFQNIQEQCAGKVILDGRYFLKD
jgi:UDPglucose 6-dehydrogenase